MQRPSLREIFFRSAGSAERKVCVALWLKFMSHNIRLFGTDGIRGEANRYPMDGITAFTVGQALVHLLKKESRRCRVIVGRDTRVSGPMLESALAAGITSMGGDPTLAGILPTPAIAYLARSLGSDAGIVISASHNPYQDNGIKIFSGEGFKLTDEQEKVMEKLILGGKLSANVPPVGKLGQPHPFDDAEGRYVEFLERSLPSSFSLKGTRIVIDTANGATYRVAPQTFSHFGAQVDVIHDQPDGLNINDRCGSQHTLDLQNRVVQGKADLGLAFDGDGDRLIAVDEKGRRLTGDQILVICARSLKDQGKLRHDLLVSTVMSNLGLTVACKKYGFSHHTSKVGDRYVLEEMLRLGAAIGGEESGHLIFLDHHTTGDGIMAALQLLAAMMREGKPLSELASLMEIYPQKLINVSVSSKPEITSVPSLAKIIKQVESELGDRGRVLVRYSGTENVCRVMVEGPSEDLAQKFCEQIADAVRSTLG
jgi:phosphoglucosamine mutase